MVPALPGGGVSTAVRSEELLLFLDIGDGDRYCLYNPKAGVVGSRDRVFHIPIGESNRLQAEREMIPFIRITGGVPETIDGP
jgi:hypothetical protein